MLSQHQRGSLDFQRRLHCQHDLQRAPLHKASFLCRNTRGFRATGSQSPWGGGGQTPQSGGIRGQRQRINRRIWEETPHCPRWMEGAGLHGPKQLGRGCRALPGPPTIPQHLRSHSATTGEQWQAPSPPKPPTPQSLEPQTAAASLPGKLSQRFHINSI